MKITKFDLFENSKQTLGNSSGMGNVKAPQPYIEPEKVIETKTPPVVENNDEETDVNESVYTFNNFNEGVATATLGNTSGMGDVSAPPVSTDGSNFTYDGDGSPSETVGRGSGDTTAKSEKKKKKKKKATKESRHFGTETDKKDMYVTSWSDWLSEDKKVIYRKDIEMVKGVLKEFIDFSIKKDVISFDAFENDTEIDNFIDEYVWSGENISESIYSFDKDDTYDEVEHEVKGVVLTPGDTFDMVNAGWWGDKKNNEMREPRYLGKSDNLIIFDFGRDGVKYRIDTEDLFKRFIKKA